MPGEDLKLQSMLDICNDRLNRILIKLDNLFHIFKSTSLITQSTPQPTQVVETIKENVVVDKYSAVHTLNWKFNGKTCVKAFLQRLEELCLSRAISNTKLFNSAAELFSEEALCWYRGVRNEVNDWISLKSLLIEEYLPYDYDHRLMKEIRERSQGSDESIVNYLSIMQNYFDRQSKSLPDEEKLCIVLFNLRPFYTSQLALHPTETWSELKKNCRLLENAKQRSELFTEPPKNNSTSLAPDLSYKGQRLSKVHVVRTTTTKPDFCVRCRTNGHNLTTCKAPHTLVCFRCGEKGVTTRNCPKCSETIAPNAASKN